ncbi:thioesterase II family protein [Aquimarina hainanensis]|uniref:Thioesterase II family protein n=1 Tax=Aquimarina hainanensis TaxID=1578017 RepID=A0ABW5N4K9_9FLAO
MKNIAKWFPYGIPDTKTASVNVFCFHYAGGSATAYKDWALSDTSVSFIPIELPGRGTRIMDPLIEDFSILIPELVTIILPFITPTIPFYFFGHSMGGAIAFELAYQLEHHHQLSPEKIIIAGRHAPHMPDPSTLHSWLNDEKLIEELKVLNGTPKEILENKEMIQFLLPMIRGDLRLHESFTYKNQKITASIVAHAANKDKDATKEIMVHWKEVTTGEFDIQEFAGDHFFVQQLGKNYIDLLQTLLQANVIE